MEHLEREKNLSIHLFLLSNAQGEPKKTSGKNSFTFFFFPWALSFFSEAIRKLRNHLEQARSPSPSWQDRCFTLLGLLLQLQPASPCSGQVLDCVPSGAQAGGPGSGRLWIDRLLGGSGQKSPRRGLCHRTSWAREKVGCWNRDRGRAVWGSVPVWGGSPPSKLRPADTVSNTAALCSARGPGHCRIRGILNQQDGVSWKAGLSKGHLGWGRLWFKCPGS